MKAPRLIAQAFEIVGDERRPLGDVDLTRAVLQDMNPHGKHVRAPRFPPYVGSSINDEMRSILRDERLAMPGLQKLMDDWLEEIGGLDGVCAMKAHMDALQQAEWALERALRQQKDIDDARFAAASEFEMFCPVDSHQDFVFSIDEAYDDWGWDNYIQQHPRPDLSFDSPDYKAWSDSYRAWVRTSAPPFVHGTFPSSWEGLSEDRIRAALEEEERIDIDEMIYNDMEEHFEDAYDHIQDIESLQLIIDEWEPHAGSGNEIDLGLGKKLEEWNAKQSITSYYQNLKTVVPAFKDVDMNEIKAWSAAKVERCRAEIETIANTWELPDPVASTPI